MPARDVPARTWLLAACAGWAVAAWVLALAGMGRTAPILADDGALQQRLPNVRAAAPPVLGPPGQYAAISARPVFSENRLPKPFFIEGQGQATAQQAFDYVLTSVLITRNLKMAILQPADGSESLRVKLGEAPEPQPSYRLSSVLPRSAVFDGPEGPRTLELRVFDGQGGQSPTQVSAAPPPPPPNAPPPSNVPMPSRPMPPSGGVPPATMSATPVPPPGASPPNATMRNGEGITEPPLTEAAQMEAIRQRIEARRAQLRQQAQNPPTPP